MPIKNKTAGSDVLPAVPFLANSQLPVSATAVESTSPMEATSASAVKATSASTVETVAMETRLAVETASGVPMPANVPASIASVITTDVTVPVTPTAAAIVAAIPEPGRVSPVVPRTDADKHSVHKVIGTIESIRRTSIGIVIVVSPLTDWRPSHIGRPNTDSNTHAHLGLRIGQRHHQHCQQRKIFQVTHINPLGSNPPKPRKRI